MIILSKSCIDTDRRQLCVLFWKIKGLDGEVIEMKSLFFNNYSVPRLSTVNVI